MVMINMPIIICGYCEYVYTGNIIYNDDVIKAYTDMLVHEEKEHIDDREYDNLIKKEGL